MGRSKSRSQSRGGKKGGRRSGGAGKGSVNSQSSIVNKLAADIGLLTQAVARLSAGKPPVGRGRSRSPKPLDSDRRGRSASRSRWDDRAARAAHSVPGGLLSGYSGVASSAARHDVLTKGEASFKADDECKHFIPSVGASWATEVKGKDAVLKAIRLVFSDDYTEDIGGHIRVLATKNEATAPAGDTQMKNDPSALLWYTGKLPKHYTIVVPSPHGDGLSALADKDLPRMNVSLVVLRKRNGLAATDTVLTVTVEWLFSVL